MYLLSAQISEILREISSQKLAALVHFSLLADLHLEVMPEETCIDRKKKKRTLMQDNDRQHKKTENHTANTVSLNCAIL